MTRFFKIIRTIATVLLLFGNAAFAQTAATDKFLFEEMLKLASKGEPEAEYHIGMFFNNGIGTAANPGEAFQWFKKSAAAGDPLGAYKLGCYYAGQFAGVVDIDQDMALKYKLVAAEQGYDLAQSDVARHHYASKNYPEAIRWLTEAAKQGDPGSMYRLSALYAQGQIVPNDLVKSYLYLDAMRHLPEIGSDKQIADAFAMLTTSMSETELATAKKNEALSIEPSALTLKARNGLTQAKFYLAANMQ